LRLRDDFFPCRSTQTAKDDENSNLLNEMVSICKQRFEAMKTTELIKLLNNNLQKFLDK
jgi:hypothetical protein